MSVRFSDQDIDRMVQEVKLLQPDYRKRIRLREKRGHKEQELVVTGVHGTEYRLLLRQSLSNELDFSIILATVPHGTNVLFRLRRYNGRSHEHTNTLEGITFYEFHVHHASERYQDLGAREDSFAEPTDRFGTMNGAVQCMLKECSFAFPEGSSGEPFEESVLC